MLKQIKNKGHENMKKIIVSLTLILSISFADGFSGLSYFGYSRDGGFELTRTYLTYDKNISDIMSFKFQTDVGQIGDARWDVYLKKAQLDWKVSDETKLSIGLIGNNMFSVQEKTWGKRFIAKSALDKAGWKISAADLGIGYSYNFKNTSVSLLITNGEGYKNSDVDENQMLSFQFVYGEKRLDKNIGYNIGLVHSTLDLDEVTTETVTGAFGGWSNNIYTIAAEQYTKSTTGFDNQELSSFGITCVVENNVSLFIRQDINDNVETFIAGLTVAPSKGLIISPNITQTDNADNEFKFNFQFNF